MAEAQQTSDFPTSLDSWVSLTDKEDLAEVSDINKIKAAILAVQTELGTDVAGSLTDLVTRLDYIQNSDGAVQKGTSFPGTGLVDGQMFYRTDEDVLYIYDGAEWDSQGQSLSNVIYTWTGCDDITSGRGIYIGTDLSIAPATNTTEYIYRYTDVTNTAVYSNFEGFNFKFKKIAGITTLTVLAKSWCELSGVTNVNIRLDVGGGTATGTSSAFTDTSPAWQTAFTVDVSGLVDGTVYDCKFQASSNGDTSGSAAIYISNVQVIGS